MTLLENLITDVSNLWKGIGNAGINFLNILPKLGIQLVNFLRSFHRCI